MESDFSLNLAPFLTNTFFGGESAQHGGLNIVYILMMCQILHYGSQGPCEMNDCVLEVVWVEVEQIGRVNCPCPEQGRNLNSQLSSAIFAPILPTEP